MRNAIKNGSPRTLSAFVTELRGNVAMMFAFLVLPLLIVGGMAVDFARSAQAEAVVQDAADAAALRVARARIDEPNLDEAKVAALGRQVLQSALSRSKWIDIESFEVSYDEKSRRVLVEVATSVPTSLVRVIGVNKMQVDKVSQVEIGEAVPIEIALALDVTGSMNQKNKIGDLRTSASDLIETVFKTTSAAKVSVIPFAQYVNVGAENKGESWVDAPTNGWFGCVGSRPYPLNISDDGFAKHPAPGLNGNNCPPAILPLTSDKPKALKAIAGLKADGWTYIPAGLIWAWRTLSPEAPFVGGMSYSEMKEKKGLKALILLTDGMNTRAPSYPQHDNTNAALADSLLKEACKNVKETGITIYTIAFDLNDTGIKKLLSECASAPENYFDAENSKDLAVAFQSIGASITTMRLTR